MIALLGRLAQRGKDVCIFKVGVVFEDFLMTRPGSQQAKHILDANAQAADAGSSATLARLSRRKESQTR